MGDREGQYAELELNSKMLFFKYYSLGSVKTCLTSCFVLLV